MNVQGFNHITINVSNLETSLSFYVDRLGMTPVHKGERDCYLEWGTAWICLQQRPDYQQQREQEIGIDHVAFSIQEAFFHDAVSHLKNENIEIVRGPVKRGSGWTVNFLDPDGTQLELHTSTLEERMKVWR